MCYQFEDENNHLRILVWVHDVARIHKRSGCIVHAVGEHVGASLLQVSLACQICNVATIMISYNRAVHGTGVAKHNIGLYHCITT